MAPGPGQAVPVSGQVGRAGEDVGGRAFGGHENDGITYREAFKTSNRWRLL